MHVGEASYTLWKWLKLLRCATGATDFRRPLRLIRGGDFEMGVDTVVIALIPILLVCSTLPASSLGIQGDHFCKAVMNEPGKLRIRHLHLNIYITAPLDECSTLHILHCHQLQDCTLAIYQASHPSLLTFTLNRDVQK